MVEITLRDLEKSFTHNSHEKKVLAPLNILISAGEVVAIRGDNGSGKTTLLNIIAGIDFPSKGTASLKNCRGEQNKIGYVPQDYTSSLLPWFDVLENIAIPLRIKGVGYSTRRQKSEDVLTSLGFENLPRTAFPYQLSGGQKQKVAVARALIHTPDLLILDEPFANLDFHSNREIQEVLSNFHQQHKSTILFVSHELDPCVYLADRILLLHGIPAKVQDVFEINLSRPRRKSVMLSSVYSDLRSSILIAEERLYAQEEKPY